jgi:putative ABC transport system permease protein
MIRNYFKIALRNLAKNRLFSTLNIVGLATGLAVGLLILIWVQDEQSFDTFHPDAERIYRENASFITGEEEIFWPKSPAPHAAYALREIPGIEKAVRVHSAGAPLIKYNATIQKEEKGVFVDTSFFEVFSYQLLAGNAYKLFNDNNSIVVTRSLAIRFMGNETDPQRYLGKVLEADNEKLTISAVIEDFPANTLFDHSYLRPFEHLKASFKPNDYWKSLEEDWGNFNGATYFKIHPKADIMAIENKLSDLQHQHNQFDSGSKYHLQPMSELRFYEADGSDAGASTVRILGISALFILLIACINYINLATAKSTLRAKEVGMRKVIGADRWQLIAQFLVESVVVFCIASVLSVVRIYTLLPFCNDIADKQLQLDWSKGSTVGLFASVLGATLLFSATYPALILSAYQPLKVMRGVLMPGKNNQITLRKTLVVTQFVCSCFLMIVMLVVGRQLNYIRTKNLGYNREQVFMVELSEKTYNNREALRQELAKSAGVVAVAGVSDDLMTSSNSTGDLKWEGQAEGQNIIIAPIAVTPNIFEFMDIQLVAGVGFNGSKSDSTAFIVNETAIAQMGIADPIGHPIRLWQTDGKIVGVVKDFHHASLREKIKPLIFLSRPNWLGGVYVKTSATQAASAIATTEKIWKQFDTEYPFEYKFMDEKFEKMYRRETRATTLFQAFSTVAIFISCLGLFGLSAFTIEKRFKEIGIRKVLGATVSSVIALLTKDFLLLVLIAIVIATPLAYFYMDNWLTDFAYRTQLDASIFVLAAILAITIALLTVSAQSLKAALSNPVKSIKND